MARRVDKVKDVRLAIVSRVLYPRGVELDRDAPLPLQVHAVQQLLFHLALRHRIAVLQQPWFKSCFLSLMDWIGVRAGKTRVSRKDEGFFQGR